MKIPKILGAALGFLILFVFVSVLMETAWGIPSESLSVLLLGWLNFLGIMLPRVTANPLMLAEGLVVVLLVGAGTHHLFAWWYRHERTAEEEPAPAHPWRWTWSVCALAIFLLAFISGTVVSGTIHQALWLATTSEPLRNSSWGPRITRDLMNHLGRQLSDCLQRGGLPKHSEPIKLYEVEETPKCVIAPRVHYVGVTDPRRKGLSDGWNTPLMYTSTGRSYVLTSYGRNRVPGGGSGRFDDYIFSDGKFIVLPDGEEPSP